MSSSKSIVWKKLSEMTIGKAGQTSSASLGVPGVQKSRNLRRCGDPKTTLRHR